MTAMIIEDESFARAQLSKLLSQHFPQISICASADSVQGAVAYLKVNPHPQIIFMDVELSDGDSFEIFRQISVSSRVIMTTAYDNYAVKAFEAGSVDYLLKPIELSALQRAVNRCQQSQPAVDMERLADALSRRSRRLIVKLGDKIIPVDLVDIAYFYSESKANFIKSFKGETYIIDSTLDQIAREYEGDDFFRVSRSCIVARSAVRSLRHQDGKYILELNPEPNSEMSVSRLKAGAFVKWL